MEEDAFSALKNAMKIIHIPEDFRTRNIIKYNCNLFKEFCLSQCSNSASEQQFNSIFDILTSTDKRQLRRGLIFKSQVQSIDLSFESLKINRVDYVFYYIKWNSNLLALPDLDTEEGSRRQLRGRERVSSDANLRDVRPRQHSNTRNISSSSSSSGSSSSSSSNDNDNGNSNNGIQNNNENEMNNENNENENNENNENYNNNNNNNDNELQIRRPRRQHHVPSRFQPTQSPIQYRNRQRNSNILRENRGVTNTNDRNLDALEIENARVDEAVTSR
jgi:hypothetical protein